MNAKILIALMLAAVAVAQKIEYRDFNYNYEVRDEDGNLHSESRSQNTQGVVTGTMLIQLANGIFRSARYESSPTEGFRIFMDSNAPGLGNESPASAVFTISDPPAGAYDPPRRSF